LVVMHQSVSWT